MIAVTAMTMMDAKPIVSTVKMTVEQYLQLGEDPPGVRLELVNGEVAVSPSPATQHAYCIQKLSSLLDVYTEAHDMGVVIGDQDTTLGPYDSRRPDILFFRKDRVHLIGAKRLRGVPDLAVEIISPSSVQVDRRDKFLQYAQGGIAFYWIVDPEQRTLEGWRLQDAEYVETGRASGEATLRLPPFDGLEIPLKRLWWTGT